MKVRPFPVQRIVEMAAFCWVLIGAHFSLCGQFGDLDDAKHFQTIPEAVPSLLARPPEPLSPRPVERLKWDSYAKEKTAVFGQSKIEFQYWVTNATDRPIQIKSLRPSCGCTAAKLPSSPWTLNPGEFGKIDVEVDLRGKRGTLSKGISVITSYGVDRLNVKVEIPSDLDGESEAERRALNVQLAGADPQAVFKNDCRACHVDPGVGKLGKPLYDASCGICHDAEHRATMVPDLRALAVPTSSEYWKQWIESGKEGSLMPAFAEANGGPLTARQIESLVHYLATDFKRSDDQNLSIPPATLAQP